MPRLTITTLDGTPVARGVHPLHIDVHRRRRPPSWRRQHRKLHATPAAEWFRHE